MAVATKRNEEAKEPSRLMWNPYITAHTYPTLHIVTFQDSFGIFPKTSEAADCYGGHWWTAPVVEIGVVVLDLKECSCMDPEEQAGTVGAACRALLLGFMRMLSVFFRFL